MKVIDILSFIPEKYRVHIVRQLEIAEKTGLYPKMSHLCLNVFEEKLKYEQKFIAFSKNQPQTAPMLLSIAKREGKVYVTQKRKSFCPGRPKKYEDVILYTKDMVGGIAEIH